VGKIARLFYTSFITSFNPLLDPIYSLLSQGVSDLSKYILSVYQVHIVCLSSTYCLFIKYTLSV